MKTLFFITIALFLFVSSSIAAEKTGTEMNVASNAELKATLKVESKTLDEPKLIFDPAWHDFGDVVDNQKLVYKFKFSIQGGPVHVDRLVAGCGCTTTKLEKLDYLPGDTGEIEAVVDTTGFSGLIYKEIDIYINGSENASLQLGLKAQVHPRAMGNNANNK